MSAAFVLPLAGAVVVPMRMLRRSRRRVRGLQALGARVWPMFDRGVRAYETAVVLSVIAVMLDAGLSLQQAREAATELFPNTAIDPDVLAQIDGAGGLGHAHDAVYALIAGYVFAMYLPIFTLGSAI